MKFLVSQRKTEYSLIQFPTSAVMHKGGSQPMLLMELSGGISRVKEKYSRLKLDKCRGLFSGIIKSGKL